MFLTQIGREGNLEGAPCQLGCRRSTAGTSVAKLELLFCAEPTGGHFVPSFGIIIP
jgi:hypothetical protein